MPKFSNIAGRLVEAHRFINVPMRWCEQYPARERRELWIAQSDGFERKLVIHSRVMPARHGHSVDVLTWGDSAIALRNLSTGDRVNFVAVDPPSLWGRRDAVRALAATTLLCLIVLQWCTAAWLLGLLPAVSALIGALIAVRWVGRLHLQTKASVWLKAPTRGLGYSHIRRVK